MDSDSSISEFDALPRDEVVGLLVQCILRLSPTQKTILALYYHEDLKPAEIAASVGLTEGEVDQVRAETVGLLRAMLAAQIGLPELPASFDNPSRTGSSSSRDTRIRLTQPKMAFKCVRSSLERVAKNSSFLRSAT